MKTRLLLAGLLVGACCLESFGETRSRGSVLEVVTIEEPMFPGSLLMRGTTSGDVDTIINVDADGKVVDWLIAAYTQPELIRTTEEMLQTAVFKPVLINGTPQPVRARLSFQFEAHGVVVSQTTFDHIDARLRDVFGGTRIQKIATVHRLDRKLTPTRTVSPQYPAELAKEKLSGSVTLDFLVDEKGRVRMPVLDRADHRALAEAAVAALMEWQFDPPKERGRPVIVKAKQEFRFNPGNS